MEIKPMYWKGNWKEGHLVILDQTLLPQQQKYIDLHNIEATWEAIKRLQVRGAPAIGIAAAYGVILGIQNITENLQKNIEKVTDYLASSRPTAVNLFWALDRMKRTAKEHEQEPIETIKQILFQEACKIHQEDIEVCKKLGEYGASLIPNKANLMTHCNAGGLATSGYGTALATFFTAKAQNKDIHVYANETRPLWQGARLTSWELQQMKIPYTLICDNTAAFLMQQGKIDAIFVGADRIATNGDTANKIGTYGIAISAWVHHIPFYIVAPLSTFDITIPNGQSIEIEERHSDEITKPYGIQIAPLKTNAYSPAFDVTPHQYITGIVTEKGIVQTPITPEKIQALFA
ncbi:MAG TPA: S-methyl-5-thioribose-1-phosphate isomerase [Planctomycetota bacterium]|nr:S-methyl-5-thioribose-1-phosphate isomerase [Planctomycetota bacterium]